MSTLTVSPEVNNCKLKTSSQNLSSIHVLPTPLSPIKKSLKRKSYCFSLAAILPKVAGYPCTYKQLLNLSERLSCAMTCTTISSTLTVITLTSRYAELFAPSTKPSHDRTTGSKQELERARNTWTRTLLLNLKRINRSIQNNIGRKIYSSNLCDVLAVIHDLNDWKELWAARQDTR